ncbi:MAG: hypothetical protein AAFY57_06630 [Cyanobacteria bacterium J06642_2]
MDLLDRILDKLKEWVDKVIDSLREPQGERVPIPVPVRDPRHRSY